MSLTIFQKMHAQMGVCVMPEQHFAISRTGGISAAVRSNQRESGQIPSPEYVMFNFVNETSDSRRVFL